MRHEAAGIVSMYHSCHARRAVPRYDELAYSASPWSLTPGPEVGPRPGLKVHGGVVLAAPHLTSSAGHPAETMDEPLQ